MTDDTENERECGVLSSPFPSEDAKKLLLSTLAMHKITNVTVEFSGHGGSGSIGSIFCRGDDSRVLDSIKIPWSTESSRFVNGAWEVQTTESLMTLRGVLESVTYAALELSNLDWYKNDGGQGEFMIDFDGPDGVNISLEMGINYMHTEDYSFHFSGTPAKDEECTPTTTASPA